MLSGIKVEVQVMKFNVEMKFEFVNPNLNKKSVINFSSDEFWM